MNLKYFPVFIALVAGIQSAYSQNDDSSGINEKHYNTALISPAFDLIIHIKNDSLSVTYNKKLIPIGSITLLDEFIKVNLKNIPNPKVEVISYVTNSDINSGSHTTYKNVAAVLKKNNITHYMNALSPPAAP